MAIDHRFRVAFKTADGDAAYIETTDDGEPIAYGPAVDVATALRDAGIDCRVEIGLDWHPMPYNDEGVAKLWDYEYHWRPQR